jgi:hypothetical protein
MDFMDFVTNVMSVVIATKAAIVIGGIIILLASGFLAWWIGTYVQQ